MKSRVVVVIGLIAAVIGGFAVFTIMKNRDADPESRVTNFAQCVAAGNDVMETDPPQCRTVDGRTFVDQTRTPAPQPSDAPVTADHTSLKGVKLVVDAPPAGDFISSPINVRGSVPGSWSFEASFGIEVLDANGEQIGEGFAMLDGEWMTEDMVDFTGTVTFSKPSTETGSLVLRRANPADEARFDDSVTIPIKFTN